MLEAILAPIARWIIGVISTTGYAGVVLCMTIESACVPLPSEIIMPFSGYLVFTGQFSIWWASLAGAFGCLVGSVLAYGIGAWGGRPFIEKYGKYVLLSKHDLDLADRWFRRWGDWAVFFSRLMPIVRTFISLPAGIARMNFPRFVFYSFVGSVPWCFFLAWVGKVLGENWGTIHSYFRRADLVIALVIGVLLSVWLYRHLKVLREA